MPQVLFTWHGGETLMRPISFYRKALELQRKYGHRRQIDNCIQTNGTLLNDDWCRFFKENNHYTIGRVSVLKEYRNQHIGNLLLKSAEKEIKRISGDVIVVHAQVRVSSFYEKQGYIQFGQIDDDEGVPHKWMKKRIQY